MCVVVWGEMESEKGAHCNKKNLRLQTSSFKLV